MNETVEKRSDTGKRPFSQRYIIAAVAAAFVILAALVYINFAQDDKPDPASEKIIREAAAKQLNKDPNGLTDVDFEKITELTISGIESYGNNPNENPILLSDIKLLEKFTCLQELILIGITYPEKDIPKWIKILAKHGILNINERFTIDLSPLRKLSKLKKLDLSYAPIKNIKPVKNLINLKELRLIHTFVSDLEPISQLTNLQELNLGGTHVNNLEPIRGIKNLQVLWLYRTPVSDLEPLKGLKNLKTLGLKDCKNIKGEQVENLEKALPNLKIGK